MTPRVATHERPSWGVHPSGAAAGALVLGALGYAMVSLARRGTSPFPRDRQFDGTWSLLREGYTFISNRCRRNRSDVFETRLMLQRVFCTQGEDAARMFYAPNRFTRRRAIPLTTLTVLQDWRSVQLLDGHAHRARKQMFMSVLMTPERIQELLETADDEWRVRIARWSKGQRVVLHDEVSELLCRAACTWAGVPLLEGDTARRAREFVAMIEASGSIGPRNWAAQLLRLRTERWIEGIIRAIRGGRIAAAPGSAAHVIAWHREPDGQLLPVRSAAVELINVLRPTVAVARYITFAALALHDHHEVRLPLELGDENYLEWFVHEVRRFYPFFPAIGGRVRSEFEWRGHRFRSGTWVLLDIYGTNHDARTWDAPESFEPERFSAWDGSAYNFIPQGGGDPAQTHRCPGEQITIELTKDAVRHLIRLRYDVPPQDLRIDMANMPAIPASRFVIANVERT